MKSIEYVSVPAIHSRAADQGVVGREALKASQRPRILDAITDLVAAHGYPGTTVREIARQASVSLSTFYEYFPDKEQCFLAAYDRVADHLLAAITAETAKAAGPREGIERGIARYFTWFAEHPTAAATFVVGVHTAGPAALARRAKIHERYRELFALAPKAAARKRRTTRQPPAAALEGVTYAIDQMTHDYVRQGRTEQLPELIPAAQELALHTLRI
jgi:AcrR family transcriptional regulator